MSPHHDRTWIDVFVEQTDRHAERVFLRDGERVLTYGELRTQVDALARGLLADGIRPGQVIGVWMSNCIDLAIAQWAVYRAGCTVLSLYSYYRGPELEHCLRTTQASALITKADFAGTVDARSLLLEVLPELAVAEPEPSFERTPALRRVLTVEPWELPATRSLEELASTGDAVDDTALEHVRGRVASLDVINIMFTSGTTGVPKGGLSMHRNNMATIDAWSGLAALTPEDVFLCPAPMFTNLGCLYGHCLALYVGASMIAMQRFDAGEALRLIESGRATYVLGTPEIFRAILDHPDMESADVSTVRSGHVAGSELAPDLMERIIDELAPEILQAYGLSECGGISTVTTVRDPRELRLTSVGRPVASVRLEIRDPHTGAPVPLGGTGEIWLGDAQPGACVGKGYFGDPAKTVDTITPDGWFRTGDLGYLDDDGYLFFAGRSKNMITVGGFNVYPREIEHFLATLPGIEEVYVVGVPDQRLGTVPVAYVVDGHDLDFDSVKAEVEHSLSSQKRPRVYWPVTRDELPFTPSGKVRIAELATLAAERWT